jgi:hypothetical protein
MTIFFLGDFLDSPVFFFPRPWGCRRVAGSGFCEGEYQRQPALPGRQRDVRIDLPDSLKVI